MNETATKIQAVINTLQDLDIKAQEKNMTILLSCYQVLGEVRDALNKMVDIELEVPNENNHAE